ncbi:NUMOD4 motif-containing HNH endonuclease [Lysinibacillus pakistanensis]|uniref:NUMOD4 motif-containing HNH endonuclease n=1 Tax=Lysinibacillus pakistanensis TaxID=759811 RepID=UPI003D2B52DB
MKTEAERNKELLTMEQWKAIVEFEGFYEVSNLGRVRSLDRVTKSGQLRKGKYINSSYINKCGYKEVRLYVDGKQYTKLVHRLIAMAFIPNPFNLGTVNHIDGVKTNNDISNLEWCTQEDNNTHAWRTGLIPSSINNGENNRNAKLTLENIKEIRETYVPYSKEFGAKQLAKRFGITSKTVGRIIRKELWKNID